MRASGPIRTGAIARHARATRLATTDDASDRPNTIGVASAIAQKTKK